MRVEPVTFVPISKCPINILLYEQNVEPSPSSYLSQMLLLQIENTLFKRGKIDKEFKKPTFFTTQQPFLGKMFYKFHK